MPGSNEKVILHDGTTGEDANIDSNRHLQVDIAADSVGIGGGTQYTEGATDETITGTAILWEDTSNTLRAVSAAKPLPVEVTDASIAVTGTFWQETQPISGSVTVSGTVSVSSVPSTVVTASNLDIRDLSNTTDSVLVYGNTAKDGSGTDYIPLLDTDGHLQIDVLSAPTTAVTGTFWQETQPISGSVTVSGSVTADLGVNNDVTVTSGAITETNSGSIKTAVELIDNYYPDVAHDAADSGNPLKVGHKAVLFNASAPPNAAAAEDDRVNSIADEYGRQYVEITHPNYWDVSADYAGAQTNTTIKAAPGAGLSLYITDLTISNGATAGNITLLDGSGGTVKYELYAPINGGCIVSLRSPIKLTANTLLAITSTTVTTHSVTVSGFIAP